MPQSSWKAIILDLGDVIFKWTAKPTGEAGATLKSIMKSDIYAQYETGQIETEREFSEILGQQLGVDGSYIQTTFQDARESLQANTQLVDFIRDLKQTTGVTIYAMSNIPRSDIDSLQREHPHAMDIFDRVFASGYAGVRKPDPQFFKMVIEEGRLSPEKTIFIDDKVVNVDAARSVGMYGVSFEGVDALCDLLRDLLLREGTQM
jgi:HAD superfamily hydrolase (TIGR01509 family)